MNITNKKVLITGGGSGIGFEIAKQLIEKGNQVLITGRTESKLEAAAASLGKVLYFACDVNNDDDINNLLSYIGTNLGGLDLLINNAGQASAHQLGNGTGAGEKAGAEIATNYLAVIRLTDKLLPLLKQSDEAAIVNVTSILAFLPHYALPTYSASKAALHSYTQALRFSLGKSTNIKVFELMPPLVNTEFSREIGGEKGMAPEAVADELTAGLEKDTFEIHVGQTAQFYQFFHSSPAEAFNSLNS